MDPPSQHQRGLSSALPGHTAALTYYLKKFIQTTLQRYIRSRSKAESQRSLMSHSLSGRGSGSVGGRALCDGDTRRLAWGSVAVTCAVTACAARRAARAARPGELDEFTLTLFLNLETKSEWMRSLYRVMSFNQSDSIISLSAFCDHSPRARC